MTLLEQISNDYKEAMKARNDVKKSVLNFLLAQIKNKKIEMQKDPEDADVISLIKKEIKMISESIGFIGKSDHADKQGEIAIEMQKKAFLEIYLPATMNAEQTKELIEKIVVEQNITDLRTQRGLLMKELMANYKSEIDGSLVNEIINGMIG